MEYPQSHPPALSQQAAGQASRPEPAPGTLYVVSTPIGNLEDVSFRAMRILSEADLVAAEDTRQSRKLLERYGVKARLASFHDYNKEQRAPKLLQELRDGKSIALVSDAGTPGISDPGYYLIRMAIQNGIPVVPVPGPTALVAALVVSGLPTDKFVFEGFLPNRSGRRRSRLAELSKEERTIVAYESPHRVLAALRDILEVLGDRQMAVARELTKRFEEVRRGPVSELVEHLEQHPPRGEMVLVISGQKPGTEKAKDKPAMTGSHTEDELTPGT